MSITGYHPTPPLTGLDASGKSLTLNCSSEPYILCFMKILLNRQGLCYYKNILKALFKRTNEYFSKEWINKWMKWENGKTLLTFLIYLEWCPKIKNISLRIVFSFSPFHGGFWPKVQTFVKEIEWFSSLLGISTENLGSGRTQKRELFMRVNLMNY